MYIFLDSQSVVRWIDAFIATFRTTTANESITLPYRSNGTYSGTIDWGDGTVVANSYANRTHTYINSGDYDVEILGECVEWSFGYGSQVSKDKIIDVKNWGIGFSTGNVSRGFFKCINLDVTATDILDLTNSNITFLFYGTSIMQFNNSIGGWDISSITNLSNLFNTAILFNQDISAWDTSNVTSFKLHLRGRPHLIKI